MSKLRHKPEQIIRKLRQAELLCGRGKTIEKICRELGVSDVTYYKWRKEFTDRDGTTRTITEDGILVVTPYNVQVNYLRSILPGNAKVGVVDKLQDQEAPIVMISMVTSSAEDLPRNIEFLYSKNRLNVAVSRTQCLPRWSPIPNCFKSPAALWSR